MTEKNLIIKIKNTFIRANLILLCLCIGTMCIAQQSSIEGRIMDNKGEEIPGVHVQLSGQKTTVTNESGKYKFENLKADSYTIFASFIGFHVNKKDILLHENQALIFDIILEEEAIQLSEVTVNGKSEATELKESVANVSVLEAKTLYAKNNNTSDVLKQISGVNVRQTGGFGSEAEVYINGMSGKQVKFFLDGIPLSYFGSGLGLNVLPVNLMERIEVYKGVVPVDFGADALGGAINIIPRKEYSNYLDVSYSFGSFNSHKANFNGQYVNAQNTFVVGFNSFYNHSDNNYYVDIEIPDEFGNPEPARARRFHDHFSNYLMNAYAGIINKNYADRLVFSVRHSGLDDDIQHNAVMSQPYGQVTYDESTTGFSLEYEKENLLPATTLKWYGGMNFTEGHFTDTTLNAYTWDGEVARRRDSGGEISSSRNLLELDAQNAISRFNISSEPWDKGKLTLNIFTSWFRRVGEDPIAAEFYREDFFANPTTLTKNAIGLAYEHTIGDRLTSYTSLKHFAYSADGYAIQNLEFQPNEQSVSNFGYSQSLKYNFTEQILVKASYEYATRLPDEIELFGNFTLVRPNPFLEPEQSHNANLGAQYNSRQLRIDINAFYRLTDNIIWLRTSQFFAQYQNLLKAMVRGLDLEIQYRPIKSFSIKANGTFQDIINRSPRNVTGSVDNRYFDARLPNIPYLFGNGELRYTKQGFMGTNSKLSTWWSSSYVHEFFLFWAVDGNKDLKNVIPKQFIQNAGISYTLPNNRLTITFEGTNLFDQKAFDNFSVQRPGRAFFITLRTFFNQISNKL